MNKEILPGLSIDGASILLMMAQRGLQSVISELQVAGGALDAAVTAAKAEQQPATPEQEQPQ